MNSQESWCAGINGSQFPAPSSAAWQAAPTEGMLPAVPTTSPWQNAPNTWPPVTPTSMPWQGVYGGWTNPCFNVFDQMPGVWNQPRQYIFQISEKLLPEFRSRKIAKRSGRFIVTERNGRDVDVGVMSITDKYIVNPREDGTFDCFFFMIQYEGSEKKLPIQIPFKDMIRRNVLPYLHGFHRNPDCDDRYIVMAFFEEALDGDDTKFLSLPEHSGWNFDGNRRYFVSAGTRIPTLASYYATDISARKIIPTTKSLQEAANDLAAVLPQRLECRLMFAYSFSGLLLPDLIAAGYKPDKILQVSYDSELNAQCAEVLLSNRDCTAPVVSQLTDCKTVLGRELESTYDGTVIVRDSSFFEQRGKREAGTNVLMNDLQREQRLGQECRHMAAVITNSPGFYDSELPMLAVSLNGCLGECNLKDLHEKISVFHSAYINLMEMSSPENNLITTALKRAPQVPLSIRQQGCIGTDNILRVSLFILQEYSIVSPEENDALMKYIRSNAAANCDSGVEIINEFRAVLSAWLQQHQEIITPQMGPPYRKDRDTAVFVDEACINIVKPRFDFIVARMKKTQRRNVVLAALKENGMLHCNNKYKRNLEVEVAPGVMETFKVYSVPKKFLTASCQTMLNTISQNDVLVDIETIPPDILPIIAVDGGMAAGRLISEDTDEAESFFVSGMTRSGKTFFLAQQAVLRAAAGNWVIILDQTGAFPQDELHKHLPEDIIEEYFTFWEIGEKGLPVNLLSLENCKTLPDSKQRIASVFAVLARLTGEVQLKALRRCVAKLAREIEAGKVRSLSETLRFFDTDDPIQADIRERLEEAFEDLEGLQESQLTWGDFLASQGRIVVISTASDGIRKSSQHIDALLASLYVWKQFNRDERMTVVLDEVEDLCLDKDGPIGTILRKGGKHRVAMLLATQEYSVDKDRLGKLIGNCAMKIVFRPKDANIDDIAKDIGVDRTKLAALEQGECVAVGGFYSRHKERNTNTVLSGRAFKASDLLSSAEPIQEPQPADTPSGDPEQEAEPQPEKADVPRKVLSVSPPKSKTWPNSRPKKPEEGAHTSILDRFKWV